MEPESGYNIRYYALGHLYLRHGMFAGWTWPDPEKGSRGMAASSYDKDYFARFKHYLKENFPCRIESAAENIAAYERLCLPGMTREKYIEHALYAAIGKNLGNFRPNLVTVFVGGGNTIANDYQSISLFFDCLFELIKNSVPQNALVIAANQRSRGSDVNRACREKSDKGLLRFGKMRRRAAQADNQHRTQML